MFWAKRVFRFPGSVQPCFHAMYRNTFKEKFPENSRQVHRGPRCQNRITVYTAVHSALPPPLLFRHPTTHTLFSLHLSRCLIHSCDSSRTAVLEGCQLLSTERYALGYCPHRPMIQVAENALRTHTHSSKT